MFEDLNPQVVILVIAMVIGGLQWLVERMKKNRAGPEEESETSLEDLYEEARREIFERQNRDHPTEEELRERQDPRPTPPVIPAPPVSRSPAAPGPTPPPIPGAPPTRRPSRPVLTKAEQDALKRVQAREATLGRSARRKRSPSRVRAILSSPSSARDAIVLREILGPPKGAV